MVFTELRVVSEIWRGGVGSGEYFVGGACGASFPFEGERLPREGFFIVVCVFFKGPVWVDSFCEGVFDVPVGEVWLVCLLFAFFAGCLFVFAARVLGSIWCSCGPFVVLFT